MTTTIPTLGGVSGRPVAGPRRVDPRDRAQLDESPVEMSRVLALFTPYRRDLTVVTVVIVATSLIAMAQPFLLRAVVDDALPNQDVGLLVAATGGMVAVAVVTQLLGVVQTWRSSLVGQRVMHGLRTQVYEHLQHQSMDFFTRTRAGEIQSRLTNDIAGMQGVVTSTATGIATNVTTSIATLVAMLALSPQLTLLSLLVVPPSVWLSRRVALVRRDLTARTQRELADMQGQVDESLGASGALLVKTLGASERMAERFRATSEELLHLQLGSQLAGRWRMAVMAIVFAAIPALVYLVAGLPWTAPISVGTVVAFTTLQAGLFRPLMGLLNAGVEWVTSMALFSRIFGYLDLGSDLPVADHPVELDPRSVGGEVRLEGVTVRYPGADVDALADVTLTVPAGTTLALVGETGSGKSTLGSLVPRLRDPDAGTVRIDGVDVREVSPASLAAVVGVVSQETYLVHGSIRENLTLARPGAGDAELWEALRTAQIAQLVEGLPEGLDTTVGARGHRFSGGEQQRLAVARTLLRDLRVLVLDEATSALDTATERELQRALDALTRGRTTLTIAHRLSTVENADIVAVLDHGRVVEVGPPAQLRAAGGAFARLST